MLALRRRGLGASGVAAARVGRRCAAVVQGARRHATKGGGGGAGGGRAAALEALQERLGHTFGDVALLESALTHASAAATSKLKDRQRLELLGDSALGLSVVAQLLEEHPAEREGELTARLSHAVSNAGLTTVAQSLQLDSMVRAGRHVELSQKITGADTLEAVVGAIFLDSGQDLQAVHAFVDRHVLQASSGGSPAEDLKSPKTQLYEWLQSANGKRWTLNTRQAKSGPSHSRTHTVKLQLRASRKKQKGKAPLLFGPFAQQTAATVREAEHAAAADLLQKVGKLGA